MENKIFLQRSSLLNRLTDVHCHVVDTPASLAQIPDLLTGRIIVMGTRPEDWESVIACHASNPNRIIPAFGNPSHDSSFQAYTRGLHNLSAIVFQIGWI